MVGEDENGCDVTDFHSTASSMDRAKNLSDVNKKITLFVGY